MATQLELLVESRSAMSGWRACHIFYHADQNRLLRQLVAPLVEELVAAGAIDRFYFVRFELGGPHVRLRWRLAGGTSEAAAEAALACRAERFFAAWPSTQPVPEEQIRAVNRALEAAAPSEADFVYPDNSWHWFPVQFEIDRYGGIDRLPDSLELFCASSARVLNLLAEHGENGTGWERTEMLRLALHLARGLSANERDFLALAGYGERFMGLQFAPIAKQADEFFARKKRELTAFVRRELDHPPADELAAGAHRLAQRLAGLSEDACWYAAASHIHMTANRLGLTNSEEVYLSRMLLLALQALCEQAPEHRWRSWVDER